MDDGIKTLVSEAFPELERELFGRAFSLEEVCGSVSSYMFRRYGVSNYECGGAMKEALTSQLDARSDLRRSVEGEANPAWRPAA